MCRRSAGAAAVARRYRRGTGRHLVVSKIDRLTRSLTDFAKIVDPGCQRRVLCFGDAAVQHHDLDGAPDPERLVVLCARSSASASATRSAACRRPHHQRCGTGIWPDRDITAFRPDVPAPRVSLPTQAARPGPDNRGKPRLLDLERRIPARDRFAPDSLLEGAVSSELVSGRPKFPVMQGKYREFSSTCPRSPESVVEMAIIINALRANSLRGGTGN